MDPKKRKAKRSDADEITNDVFMDFNEAMKRVANADKDKVDKSVEELKQAKKKP